MRGGGGLTEKKLVNMILTTEEHKLFRDVLSWRFTIKQKNFFSYHIKSLYLPDDARIVRNINR